MTDAPPLHNHKRWRDRAEELRRLAEDMRDPPTKRMLLQCAADYDAMVERAEQRAQRAQEPANDNTPPD